MKPKPFFHVDAFVDCHSGVLGKFTGNPAAVCLLEQAADPDWMQAIAAEVNLSETAFVHPEGEGFGLRWFTPTVEVDLCGHATLASAHVLWETGMLDSAAEARFFTRSGELRAARDGTWIELDFPARPVRPVTPRAGLVEALGVVSRFTGTDGFNDLVEVATETEVRNASPDFAALKQFCPVGAILTARAASDSIDFVSRYFAPSLGVNEDPVTGSSHCALGPFWQERLKRPQLMARQLSARGGVIRVEMREERVLIAGKAVTRIKGELV